MTWLGPPEPREEQQQRLQDVEVQTEKLAADRAALEQNQAELQAELADLQRMRQELEVRTADPGCRNPDLVMFGCGLCMMCSRTVYNLLSPKVMIENVS